MTPTARLKPKSHLERDPAAASPQQRPENPTETMQILGLSEGQSLAMFWISLWKSRHYYRSDRIYTEDGLPGNVEGSQAMAVAFRLFSRSLYSVYSLHFIFRSLLPSWSTLTKRNCQCQ